MGEGYWIILHDGFGVGLNMLNPRFHHDTNGNNWWPNEVGMTDEEVDEWAIDTHGLPWLDDEYPEPDDWPGGPFGSMPGVKGWKVVR